MLSLSGALYIEINDASACGAKPMAVLGCYLTTGQVFVDVHLVQHDVVWNCLSTEHSAKQSHAQLNNYSH